MFALLEPWGKNNAGSVRRRASVRTRALRTSPIVLHRVNAARANAGAVVGAHVGDAITAIAQVVEMDVNHGRSVDGDVHILIADLILRDDGANNRRSAYAAIDVDPPRGRGSWCRPSRPGFWR